ncbi:MAG TPA: glycosyltransferase family 2 protein [Bacteroidales bacterium]|nr:glycosyltransferase family 2 protein [Bacteroidales bacterium]
MSTLTIFIPAGESVDLRQTIAALKSTGVDMQLFLLSGEPLPDEFSEFSRLPVTSILSTEGLKKISVHINTPYTVLYTRKEPLMPGPYVFQRMIQVAEATSSAFVYSDYYAVKNGQTVANPLIEYQEGSLRDDFNFGSLLLFETGAFLDAVSGMKHNYRFAALYDLRLKLAQKYSFFRVAEYLYTETETDLRKSGEKQFDYVDPKNREVQIEMEKACTEYLKETGAWLAPVFRKIRFDEHPFAMEASVIIPVKNRVKTIADAVNSVLMQKPSFPFNVIIVDNHSTDGTTEILQSFAAKDERVVHVIPSRNDLGIGGCWNEAVFHPACGKFAIQLDSDDLYIDENVIARIIDEFYIQNCAMLVGSYKMVNFKLEEIPPGIIDHREWTPENGRNNALRINGLGAPRAFYTPVLRNIRVPNVSYGEDYALGITISRYYQVGRIYEPVYLCRRWEENSDAALDVIKLNTYNYYKDKLRTIELKARQLYIQQGQV